MSGKVWLVGAGPGDPGLITRAGLEALREADLVLHDALAPRALLREVKPGAEVRDVGKRAGAHVASQTEIEALMIARAQQGCAVVRLKGGDPFVFGRGSEELLACRRAGVACTVVPGVTSAVGALAYAGIPVTHRGLGDAFMVLNGKSVAEGGASWRAAASVDTLVLLMGAATLAECVERLIAEGRDPSTPAASVRWGTRPDQCTVTGTLSDIAGAVAGAGLTAPLVTVVGRVATLAGELAWFEPGPLAGRRIVVTRARSQASGLVERLERAGALVTEAPTIEVISKAGSEELRAAVAEEAEWWVFTSANGVDAAMETLALLGRDARALAGRRLAVVGEATAAALVAHGLRADFVPSEATAAALAAEVAVTAGERITLFQSALATPEVEAALARRRTVVRAVTAYENRLAPLRPDQSEAALDADAITFTSASTARNLGAALGESAPDPRTALISIGPQTSSAVRECFGRVNREAESASLDDLLVAVIEALA